MDRVDKILEHTSFISHLQANQAAETDRRFCCHNMVHFLDVARIGQILNLEEEIGLERELIYAAALLHDLGRHVQYENGTPHEIAGAQIAPRILADCGFDDAETQMITEAIRNHRNASIAGERNLNGLLYRADKLSRACFSCEAEAECNHAAEKKNLSIRY